MTTTRAQGDHSVSGRQTQTPKHSQTDTGDMQGAEASLEQLLPSSLESVLQLQRIAGNRQTQQMLKATPNVVQRDGSDGLIDLAPGVKGEVGVEGKIKSGAVVDKFDGTPYTLPADAQGFIHDIDSKTEYFVQIPADIVNKLNDVNTRDEAKTTEPSAKNVGPSDNAVRGRVPKNKVSALGVRLKHRKVKGSIFPHPPTADDVNQRGLANCYFLAALMSTASQHPSYILDMVTDNKDTVSVRFYRQKPRVQPTDPKTFSPNYVTVRKSVAVTSSGISGVGAYSATKVPWPALVMKAYAAWDGHAKGALPGFQGTYEATAWGDSTVAMEHITGEPAKETKISKELPQRYVNVMPGEDINVILPGSPKYPIVEPWSADVTQVKRFLVGRQQFDNEAGDTDQAKVTAYLTRLLAPSGLTLTDVTLRAMGSSMFNVTIQPEALMKVAYGNIVGNADRTRWLTYVTTGQYEGKSVPQAIRQYKTIGTSTTGRMDLPFFTKLLRASGVSGGAQAAWIGYMRPYLSGTVQEINYIQPDIDEYDKVANTLADGGMVSASTPDFGKAGGGISGGEDTESVPGLAGSHVYEVVAVPPIDPAGRRWLRVRNPWGNTGLGYEPNFQHKVLKSGTFDIELSEFMRYFKDISYSSTSVSMKRTFAVADINKNQKKPKKK